MKTTIVISFSVLAIVLLYSCEKDNGNGYILATAKYNGQAVGRAIIYLVKGSDTSNIIPPQNPLKQMSADASGQAYFENVEPGIYTLFANGYSQQIGRQVKGKEFVTVRQ